MKNKIKLLMIIAIVALIGFSMTACPADAGGTPGGGNPGPQTAKFESEDAEGNTYVLEITNASGRAAYAPKNGDTYVLTIIKDDTTKKSSGTVTVTTSGNSSSFVLQPETPNGSETPPSFTITIVTTNSGAQLMTAFEGTITLTSGDTEPAPTVKPVQEFLTFVLKAEKYPNVEMWTNSLNLSDFTDHDPHEGDKLKFKISGKMDKPLKWFSVGLSSHIDTDPWYKWLGSREDGYIDELPATFNYTFVLGPIDEPLAPNSVKIGFSNILWQIGDGDNSGWSHVTGSRVKDAEVGKVMATIRNFKICLIKVIPAE